MLKKLFSTIKPLQQVSLEDDLTNRLIKKEAEIGGSLFGDVPQKHRREFFCLDAHTWIWHEESINNRGVREVTTTRYDVRQDGILKSKNGENYTSVSGEEVRNLRKATSLYRQKVFAELYS